MRGNTRMAHSDKARKGGSFNMDLGYQTVADAEIKRSRHDAKASCRVYARSFGDGADDDAEIMQQPMPLSRAKSAY